MKVLLIEDENNLGSLLKKFLEENDIICEWVKDINNAENKIIFHNYDCILLDLMLPDGNGFKILNQLKSEGRNEGIIIISAQQSIDTKVEGLQMGADDYITKPFHFSELLARIHALIRRKSFTGNNIIKFNEIEIDILSKSVKVYGKRIELTKTEYELLTFFIANKNHVLSKEAIAEHITGDLIDIYDNYDFVYSHLKNIKKKLLKAGANNYIKTIYGIGYIWEE